MEKMDLADMWFERDSGNNATKVNAQQINIKEFIREIMTDILSLN